MNSTKKRKHSQKVAASALLLAVVLTMSACGDSKKPTQDQNQIEQSVGEDQLPDGNGVMEPGVVDDNESSTDQDSDNDTSTGTGSTGQDGESTNPDNPVSNNNSATDTPDPVSQPITATGEYIGQIDSNSVEIKVNNEPLSMQLSDETRSAIEELDSDVSVEIEYTEQALNDSSNSVIRTLLQIKEVK